MKSLPAADRSEKALLSTLLADPGAIEEVEGLVGPETFANVNHEHVYRGILRVRQDGRQVNIITVSEALERMGHSKFVEALYDLGDWVTGSTVPDLVAEVRAAHQRRELIRACTELASRGYDSNVAHREYVADVESRIQSLVTTAQGANDGLRKLDTGTAYRAIRETIENRGRIGQTTTLRELDAITNGLGNGHVFVIGGYPGDGKTGLAIQMIEHTAISRGRPVAFFSLEMPEDDITKRLLSRGSGVRLASMRSGHITPEQILSMDGAREHLSIAPIYIYDKPEPTIGTIRAETRRLKARVGDVGLVVIDYVQLARGNTRTDMREQEVAEVSRGGKALAKEIGCPVVQLAQLNSEGTKRANARPRASDIRESKAIWQDADVVALIYNPNKDKIDSGKQTDDGEREIIVDKNRHGPRGIAKCRFDKTTATFFDHPIVDYRPDAHVRGEE